MHIALACVILCLMEHVQAIFLNGSSSSGKTTLAKALQLRLDKSYLHIAEDMFFAALPEREYPQSDFLRYGQRLYTGFTQCVRTLIQCDNLVIVDTVAWNPGSLAGFVEALWDMRVCAIGVHCTLPILEEREQRRNDRSIGLARRQSDRVHQDALYDLEVDTSSMDTVACVDLIVGAALALKTPHAFARMKQLH